MPAFKKYQFVIVDVFIVALFTFFIALSSGCAAKNQVVVIDKTDARYKRLGKIGMPVLQKMDKGNENKYKVAIIEHNNINASIDKNQVIIFHSVNFEVFSDAELQCIFAHEIAHSVLGHYGKRVTASAVTTGVFMVINQIIPGAGYLNHLANPITTNYFSRDQERDADQLAVKNLAEMGVDKMVYVRMLQKILKQTPPNKDGGGLWATHPSLVERIDLIEHSGITSTERKGQHTN